MNYQDITKAYRIGLDHERAQRKVLQSFAFGLKSEIEQLLGIEGEYEGKDRKSLPMVRVEMAPKDYENSLSPTSRVKPFQQRFSYSVPVIIDNAVPRMFFSFSIRVLIREGKPTAAFTDAQNENDLTKFEADFHKMARDVIESMGELVQFDRTEGAHPPEERLVRFLED